jgi:propionyl-CoA carboxylase alpha chain
MFSKILIANRGEIACRIINTARKMEILTVAVFSEADKDALHVEIADEAFCIGPAAAADSYLRIEKIIGACKASGAEAVHPGYGFLSEQASFARALAAEGVVFIGPNSDAIEAMGDKIASKKVASAAKVLTVPGSLDEIKTLEQAIEIADEIGFPVMIKASAGGGGKGMRIVFGVDDVAEGFARARSEAKSSFGDDRVFIEKFITNPRHIEIQVLGDKHGQVVHLGERECSIQRRNQKIIEEAPSPLLDLETRAKMGAQAVALARAVGYDSAGTVEFVVSQERAFYFLEMNTRLQVEHPVTELITGLDLVEEMIRIAAGEPLRVTQEDVKLTGWAVESRIYAEDPTRNFLPSIGRLVTYKPPAETIGTAGDGIALRIDSGVIEGSEISIHYDPMMAKLVTHAPTRLDAINAQTEALDAFAIGGIRHNIPFLAKVMRNKRWQEGQLSTQFIEEEFPSGFSILPPQEELAYLIAAAAAVIDRIMTERRRKISQQLPTARPLQFERERVVMWDESSIPLTIVKADPETYDLSFEDGRNLRLVTAWRPGELLFDAKADGGRLLVQVGPILNGFALSHAGTLAETRVFSPREAELYSLMPKKGSAPSAKVLLCPMPGVIRSILAAEGQTVKAGEPLAIVEAMKMENILRAEKDSTIVKIRVSQGDTLAADAIIMEFA